MTQQIQNHSVKEIVHMIEVDSDGDTVPDIQAAMTRAMTELLNIEGLVFPCHLATLASNGWGSIDRYIDDSKCVPLTEHREGQGLQLPIHCLFMDSRGFTARLIVRTKPHAN